MNTIDLTTLIPRCHAGSRAKGFWDEIPNQGQQLMLAIGELAEAQEADRKGRRANLVTYNSLNEGHPNYHRQDYFCPAFFVDCIKDTVEDELADAYIRLCDYIGGFLLSGTFESSDMNRWVEGQRRHSLSIPENFGAALISIAAVITGMYTWQTEQAQKAALALAGIERLCSSLEIDLATHIDLKLAYNATRPAKHGKAY